MIHLVTAIIKPHKLGDVRDALARAGTVGMTVSEVQGFGRQRGKSETFRGSEYQIDFVPKVKVEVVVDDALLGSAIAALADAARTGQIGDGKVWSVAVDRLVRVRTGELGVEAI
jgi:nitrogen regulatory protein P-II 1